MKKILVLVFGLLLLGCNKSNQSAVEEKIANSTGVLNILEVKEKEWSGLRIIKPYQHKTIYGQKFAQNDDKSCLWVFLGDKEVVESFPVAREKADCIKLPEKVYTPKEAIFLLKDGEMKERKKFKR